MTTSKKQQKERNLVETKAFVSRLVGTGNVSVPQRLFMSMITETFSFLRKASFKAWYKTDNAELVFFTDGEFTTLKALAETIIPHGGNPVYSANELEVPKSIDKFVSQLGMSYKKLIPMLLFAVEYMPMLRPPFRVFSKLTEPDRVLFLKRLENSSIGQLRLILLMIKMIVAQGYFNDERVFGDIRFGGPWVKSNPPTNT